MRHFATFAAALLLLPPGGSAQSQVKLAVTGGANLSTLDFDNPVTWRGGALGLAFGFPVSDKWSIQLAGRLSGKGYWEEHDTDACMPGYGGCVAASGIQLIYSEFMFLSDRRIKLGEGVSLHLLTGPFLGHQSARSSTRSLDFGVAGGAQAEVELGGNWGFQAGALYAHGLVNTRRGASQKTRTLTLRGGLSYSIR